MKVWPSRRTIGRRDRVVLRCVGLHLAVVTRFRLEFGLERDVRNVQVHDRGVSDRCGSGNGYPRVGSWMAGNGTSNAGSKWQSDGLRFRSSRTGARRRIPTSRMTRRPSRVTCRSSGRVPSDTRCSANDRAAGSGNVSAMMHSRPRGSVRRPRRSTSCAAATRTTGSSGFPPSRPSPSARSKKASRW